MELLRPTAQNVEMTKIDALNVSQDLDSAMVNALNARKINSYLELKHAYQAAHLFQIVKIVERWMVNLFATNVMMDLLNQQIIKAASILLLVYIIVLISQDALNA